MRPHTLALMAALLLIICAFGGSVSAEATISASTATPIPGEQITFTVGTTMEGLEAVINTTGLSYVSNTGLGNSNHVITVPGVGTAYTYTVTAQPGETVSFILSDVREADADGNEREGQRAVWMASAGAAPSQEPSGQPSQNPSEQPSDQPSQNPSDQPSQNPSDQPSGNPSEQPSGAPGSNPPASDQPTTSGNPSPTVQPTGGDNNNTNNGQNGGTVAGNVTGGGDGNAGGSSGGTSQSMPRTGDISHFWALLGILGILLVVAVIAGKRVFAED